MHGDVLIVRGVVARGDRERVAPRGSIVLHREAAFEQRVHRDVFEQKILEL